MSWKIYSYPNNPRVWKSLIAAEYVGIQIEYPPFNIGVDNKSKEFLAKFPVGKVPVLETPEGNVFESNAIARHVARQGHSKLYGSSHIEAAQVDQWIDFSANEIELPSAAWLFPILNIVPFHKEATEKAKGDIKKALTILNNHLNTKTFLVGERISLADIVVATGLYRLYSMVFDPGFRKPFPNVTRWYLTVVNQPHAKKVMGHVELCEKMQVAVEPVAQAPAPAAAATTTTTTTTSSTPDIGGDGEGDGENTGKKEKKVNPLDLLPKSKLEMDEWKRTYSNTPKIKEEAMPWFWANYDPEGYSIWRSDYKYNAELDKMFLTCNRVGGFVQRLDPLRKYGFGSLLIFGDEEAKKFDITGVWLFRGTTVPAEMAENDDAAHHNFTKLDTNDPATRALIEDFWAWGGTFAGKELPFLNDGRLFK